MEIRKLKWAESSYVGCYQFLMLAIFDSHPVQYRAPLYRALQQRVPDRFHVFYATDISMRGNLDKDFGRSVAWDEPLLEGYPNSILKQERGGPLKGFSSLHGKELVKVFNQWQPQAILQTQYLYEYDFAILLQAKLRGIPVWIRQETQDEASRRSAGKALIRSMAYRLLYATVNQAFYIGELNRQHYLKHGLQPQQLIRAPYCTPDRFADLSEVQFNALRQTTRSQLGIAADNLVIAFFGKLIPKKNPDLLIKALKLVDEKLREHITLLFVGSGQMESELKEQARQLPKVQTIFAGFVNQSAIAGFYAATDILVLPSRYAGETWGLVVNEALQAGCAVVISEAVGCHREFGKWERVRTIPVGDAAALARSIEDLAIFPRSFDWARQGMADFSTEAAAAALAEEIKLL